MSAIVLVDTSVLLNVLDVPGFNQHRQAVMVELAEHIEASAHLFIPMAAVIESGNHIAQLADGRLRRAAAQSFVATIQAALNDEAPWKPMNFPGLEVISDWLQQFPDAAMAGLGMGDLSIKNEWLALCQRHQLSRVRVWSLDQDLQGLDRQGH
jgi:hypothetical protein